MTDPGRNPQLTDYEMVRAQKIERNIRRMVELGLLSPSKAKLQVEAAWKIASDTDMHVKMGDQRYDKSLNDSHGNKNVIEAKFVSYVPANLVPFLDKILEIAVNLSDQDGDTVSV
jgi:hypothetical protein